MTSLQESLARQLEELRALPDVPDTFRLCLFGLEALCALAALLLLSLCSYCFVRCRTVHANLKIIQLNMNTIAMVERCVRAARILDMVGGVLPAEDSVRVENLRRWLWWYCNMAYVYVVVERIVATIHFKRYEDWSITTAVWIILVSVSVFYIRDKIEV